MNGLKYICLACIIPFLPSCIQEEHTGDAGDDGRVTVSLTFTTRTEEGADEGMESDEGNNENLIRTVRVYVFDGKGNQYRICLDQFGDLEVYASDGRIIIEPKVSNHIVIKSE